MTDEPITDVAARVLALAEKAAPGPWECFENDGALMAAFRTDAVTLARAVVTLTEERANAISEQRNWERYAGEVSARTRAAESRLSDALERLAAWECHHDLEHP